MQPRYMEPDKIAIMEDYVEARELGRELSYKPISSSPNELELDEALALYTFQFAEAWGDYRLKDIPFMTYQIEYIFGA